MSGQLIVITAPSGAGKTSLVDALLQREPALKLSISYTTRPPRPGEQDGVNYHFINHAAFEQMISRGDLLEHALVYGNYYGTSRSWIESQMQAGNDVLLEIDWQGAAQVKRLFPGAIRLFILPPSLNALEERLTKRGKDSPEVIAKRLAAARAEIAHVLESEYIIVNDQFPIALEELASVVRSQRLATARQKDRLRALLREYEVL